MTTALLIVDVQNDFCEGGSLAVTGGARVAADIADHIESHGDTYALIASSQDWHHAGESNGGHFAADGTDPDYVTTWPIHCVAETQGADFHPNLDPVLDSITLRVRKGQGEAAYSAFEGVAGDGHSLADHLRDNGIHDLDVVGIATDHCVRASVLDAMTAGFDVRLLTSMMAAVDPERGRAATAEMLAAGATAAPSVETQNAPTDAPATSTEPEATDV